MTGAEGAATSSSGTPALLATHKPLLDAGRLQDDEPYLAGTARRPTAVLAADLAAAMKLCEEKQDYVSRELLEELRDSLDGDSSHSPKASGWFEGVKRFFGDL